MRDILKHLKNLDNLMNKNTMNNAPGKNHTWEEFLYKELKETGGYIYLLTQYLVDIQSTHTQLYLK